MEDKIHSSETRVISSEKNLHQLLQEHATQTRLLHQLLNTPTALQTLSVDDNKKREKKVAVQESKSHIVVVQSLKDLEKGIEAKRKSREVKFEMTLAEELRVHTEALAKAAKEGKNEEVMKLGKAITKVYSSTNNGDKDGEGKRYCQLY